MALRYFEMSLPIGRLNRRVIFWTESVLIQLPSLFLLIIACLAEFLAFDRGIRFKEFLIILLCFIILMTINNISLNLFQRALPQLYASMEIPSMGRIRIELRKLLILFKNRRRQFTIGTLVLLSLSVLGWSIAWTPSADQPKQFLWV